jgi:hypothetical protein
MALGLEDLPMEAGILLILAPALRSEAGPVHRPALMLSELDRSWGLGSVAGHSWRGLRRQAWELFLIGPMVSRSYVVGGLDGPS